MGSTTKVEVRVLAKGGKYIGDDIGGAQVDIQDAYSGELLASGVTRGGAGPADLMSKPLTRAQLPSTENAACFTAELALTGPRLVRVTARGPLAGMGSANTVSATEWVWPASSDAAGAAAVFLLEIPGLVVQIVNPPTHLKPVSRMESVSIQANVTMMCGCPIGTNDTPWFPKDFVVRAVVTGGNHTDEVLLAYDDKVEKGAPSQFTGVWKVPADIPANTPCLITVFASEQVMGNTGLARGTVIIP